MTIKSTTIHAIHGLTKMTDPVLTPVLDATVKGLTANSSVYSTPSIPMATYSAGVSAYEAAISAALDGGKIAVAQKNKLRSAAIKMYDQLAAYVTATCNDDMATFLLSGFQAVSSTKTATLPASDSIRKIDQGANSGSLAVTLVKYTGAGSYLLRWAPVPAAGATPATWSSQAVLNVKSPVTISGLTPGTVYAFQVAALTHTGYTDWSDSVTLMCT
jgi:hypothetical protein